MKKVGNWLLVLGVIAVIVCLFFAHKFNEHGFVTAAEILVIPVFTGLMVKLFLRMYPEQMADAWELLLGKKLH